MMLCPLKFARYEFEGGEECVGAECGFYGCVCGSVDAHSKAQSKTEPKLSELFGILSDANDDSAPESVITPEAVDANDANVTQDTREKLEEVAWQYDASYAEPYEHGAIAEAIIELLDRQAAIAERETIDKWDMTAALRLAEQDRTIVGYAEKNAELQAAYDELAEQLEAAHAKNRALKAHISKMQHGRHGWHVKGEELQRQVDELTAQLHASNAERARLRECLGIATDNAHDFLTLVDESGNVYDRDEGLA